MKVIAWLIPELIKGSGGHRTILHHAKNLEKNGYECHIYIEGVGENKKGSHLIEKLFGYSFSKVQFGWENIAEADGVIATVWYSAQVVRDINFNCKKFYFVQDYEAMFNPMGDGYLMAEASYGYGLTPITIGNWLRHELKSKFDVNAYSYNFGANLEVYKKLEVKNKRKSICFIYQPEKPRRCASIGLNALGIVKHMRPDIDVYIYGSNQSDAGNIWFDHVHMGLLDLNQCNDLYNKSTLGLCLSSSNPSRIPFEMMAAGLPVVELYRENNLYDLPSSSVAMCQPTPEAIASCILELIDKDDVLENMSASARDFMKLRSQDLETNQFFEVFNSIMSGEDVSYKMAEKLYSGKIWTSNDCFNKSELSSYPLQAVMPLSYQLKKLPKPVHNVARWAYRKFVKFSGASR